MSDLQVVMAVFVGYLLLLVVLALWSSGESKSVEGYYVAGKKLPFWVVAFSTNATGESGWLLLGLTGMGYAVGIHALWVVVGETIGVALVWMLIARRFKSETDKYDSITVPDYFVSRFNDARNILRFISVAVILCMTATYTAAQLVATGKAFSQFMPISYGWGVILGCVITLFYTAIGGFKAVAYTDVVQGILMLAALIVVPLVAIDSAGGWTAVTRGVAEIDAGMMDWMGEYGFTLPGFIAVVSFLAIGLPFLGVPQLLVRFISINSAAEVKKAGIISVVVILIFDLGAVLAGMAGRVLFPDLGDPELIMPTLSSELFPPIITGLMVVVILAAIMSTVDSLFILASSAFTRDLIQKVLYPNLSDEQLAKLGKLITVIIGVGGALIALSGNRLIFWFVMFSWSGLGATFGPTVLCSLYWKKTTLWGVAAGMLGGFLTTVLWVLFFKESTYGLYEMVPGFIAGLLLTIIVSRLTHKNADGVQALV